MNMLKALKSIPARIWPRARNHDRGRDHRLFFGGWAGDHAGMPVNEHTALQIAAVNRAVNYIADMLMVMPWGVYQMRGDSSGVRIESNLDYLLNQQANRNVDARSWRNTMVRYTTLLGNSYAQIIKDNRGVVQELGTPIHPAWVCEQIDRETGLLFYRVRPYNTVSGESMGQYDIPARDMFHFKGPGDGYRGMSVIQYAARTFGIGLAQDQNQASFFANGSRTSGVLSAQTALSVDARDNLEKYLQEHMQGPNKAWNLLVLEEGMKWEPMGIPNDQAQMVQLMNANVIDIARWFGLPPHILMDYSSAKWNSLEHASTEAVVSGLLPWAVRLETEANLKLIGINNRSTRRTKINLKGLLRADTQTRNEAYAKGRQWGWLSANDVRRLEDMPLIEGGDIYLSPLNMVPADSYEERAQAQGATNQYSPDELPGDSGQQTRDTLGTMIKASRLATNGMRKALFKRISHNIISREMNTAKQLRDKEDFDTRITGFMRKHQGFMAGEIDHACEILGHVCLEPSGNIKQFVMDYIHQASSSIIDAWRDASIDEYIDAFQVFEAELSEQLNNQFEEVTR